MTTMSTAVFVWLCSIVWGAVVAVVIVDWFRAARRRVNRDIALLRAADPAYLRRVK